MPAPDPTDRPPEPETVPMLMVPVQLLRRCQSAATVLARMYSGEYRMSSVHKAYKTLADDLKDVLAQE